MDEPVLLQLDPERFRVLLGGGVTVVATLPHATRRGLGLHGVPPVAIATEIVRFLLERDAFPRNAPAAEVAIGQLAGAFPEFVEEVRSRFG